MDRNNCPACEEKLSGVSEGCMTCRRNQTTAGSGALQPLAISGAERPDVRGWFAVLGLVLLATTFNNLSAAAEFANPTFQYAITERLGGLGNAYLGLAQGGALVSASICGVAVVLMALRSTVARSAAVSALAISAAFLVMMIALSVAGAEASGRDADLADAFAIQALASGAKVVIIGGILAYIVRSAKLRTAYGPFRWIDACVWPLHLMRRSQER